MRLFVAVNFDSNIITALNEYTAQLKAAAISGSFTRKENLHLTLAFIGETDRVKEATQAVRCVSVPSFTLELSEVGVFKRYDGDIYWIGARKSQELIDLQNQVVDKLIMQGFTLENRFFTPHITLGRRVFLHSDFAPVRIDACMTVSKISLMKSEQIGGRLVYKQIYNH